MTVYAGEVFERTDVSLPPEEMAVAVMGMVGDKQ